MQDLQNITLRIVTHYTVSVLPILKDLQLISNFSSQLTEVSWQSVKFGDPFEIHFKPMFERGEVDFVIGYYYLTISRIRFAVPLHPVINEKFWGIYRQPHFSSVKNIYSQPFSQELFFAWSLITILFIISVSIGLKCLKVFNFWDSVQEGFWWVVAFVSLKNHPFLLVGPTLRILFLCGTLFSSLIFAIYSASITSALLTNEVPIKSISDLIQFGFSFYSHKEISKSILIPGLHKAFVSKDDPDVVGILSFQRVLNGAEGHVHVDNFQGLSFYAERLTTPEEFCKKLWRLRFAQSTIIVSAFFVPKDSPYRDVINFSLLRLRESGLLRRHNQVYNANKNFDCPKEKRKYEENLGISHVFSAFLFLLCSIPLVILAFVAEKITRKKV